MGMNWKQADDAAPDLLDQQAADIPGQGIEQAQGTAGVSQEAIEAMVSAQVQRALEQRLGSLRQDLTGEVERKVQSFSDKAYSRLSARQQEDMAAVDRVLEGMQDILGPDYETIRRQKKLDILTRTEPAAQPEPTAQIGNGQQPHAGQDNSDSQAQAYLTQRLGEQSLWTPQQQRQILAELAQARDNIWQWVSVVDKYAAQKPQPAAGAPANGGGIDDATRAARAQPMGGGSNVNAYTPEQLDKMLYAAHNAGDYEEAERIGKLIDRLVEGNR